MCPEATVAVQCCSYKPVTICTFTLCWRCENGRTHMIGMGRNGAVFDSAIVRVRL